MSKTTVSKPIKPRRMWANYYAWRDFPVSVHLTERAARKGASCPKTGRGPVLVIDLSSESRTDLRLRIAEAIAESYGGDHFSPICLRATEAVLAAIGIRAVKPKRK